MVLPHIYLIMDIREVRLGLSLAFAIKHWLGREAWRTVRLEAIC